MTSNMTSKGSNSSLDGMSDKGNGSRPSSGSGRRTSAVKLTAELRKTSTTKLASVKSWSDLDKPADVKSKAYDDDLFLDAGNMEEKKKVDECLKWITNEQMLQESADYGLNRKAVEEAVKEQKKTQAAVDKYSKEVEKVQKATQNDKHKESLDRQYGNLKTTTDKRMKCLETITDVVGMEDLFVNISHDLSVKSTKLVADDRKKDVQIPEFNSCVANSAQGCILAVRNNWNWMSKLMKCSGVHLQNASDYHQFFHEIHEYFYWMPAELRKASDLVNRSQLHSHPDREDAAKLLLELKTANSIFLHWQGKVDSAFTQSKKITPVNLRSEKLDHFRPVSSLCNYKTSNAHVLEGEELMLLDNSNSKVWKVRNLRSEVCEVPSVILVIPGPDSEAVETAMKLRLQFLALWTNELKRIGKTLILFLLLVIREWNAEEENMLRSLSAGDKENVRHLLKEIEKTFFPYWEPYPPYQKLKQRMEKLRKLLDEKPDPKYKGSEEGKSLIIQTQILEDILHQYKMFWSGWITSKTLTETIRHPEYLLVVEDWNQYKFLELAEWLKRWQIGLEFDDADFADKDLEEVEEEINKLRMNKETAEAQQILASEQEERKRFVITGVKDPRNDKIISLDDAVALGIINQRNGTYYNPRTRQSMPIPEAMGNGDIIVEEVETNTSEERRRAMGLITINRDVGSYAVFDSKSKKNISVDEAVKKGILNVDEGIYKDIVTGQDLTFDEAIAKGLLIREIDDLDDGPETITYAVTAVVDMKNKRRLNFEEAVKSKVIDPENGEFTNNETGEVIYVRDAIERGFVKAEVVDDVESLDIKPENQVKLRNSRYMQSFRQKVHEPMKAMFSLKKASKSNGKL